MFAHAISHPSSDATSLIGTLKDNKQAIGAFKSFLDTIANDKNHQPLGTMTNFFILPAL